MLSDSLQDDEFRVLEFISRFGYCQIKHVYKLFASHSSVKRILDRLISKDYLIKLKILANQSPYLVLTQKIAKSFNSKYIKEPTLKDIKHNSLLIDLFLYLNNCYEDIKIDTEIKKDTNFYKSFNFRIPDLLINDEIAIELELTLKSKNKLIEIINTYMVDIGIKEVHYYTTNIAVADKIKKLVIDYEKFKFFKINNIDIFEIEKL